MPPNNPVTRQEKRLFDLLDSTGSVVIILAVHTSSPPGNTARHSSLKQCPTSASVGVYNPSVEMGVQSSSSSIASKQKHKKPR